MKPLFLALVAMLAIGCAPETSGPAQGGIEWISDYQKGMALARQSGKPVMLFFTADWCPPCTELKKNVFADPAVVAASKALVNIMVDVDLNRQIMRDYRVRGIPRIFFLDPQGQIISDFSGARGPKFVIRQMEAAVRPERTQDTVPDGQKTEGSSMSEKIKADTWIWVVVVDPETNPQYMGQQEKNQGAAYIPAFLRKEDAEQGLTGLSKSAGKKYEVQAVMYDQLAGDAAANGFRIFILNAEGRVLEKIAPPVN